LFAIHSVWPPSALISTRSPPTTALYAVTGAIGTNTARPKRTTRAIGTRAKARSHTARQGTRSRTCWRRRAARPQATPARRLAPIVFRRASASVARSPPRFATFTTDSRRSSPS
jgi:hypothetical protein